MPVLGQSVVMASRLRVGRVPQRGDNYVDEAFVTPQTWPYPGIAAFANPYMWARRISDDGLDDELRRRTITAMIIVRYHRLLREAYADAG